MNAADEMVIVIAIFGMVVAIFLWVLVLSKTGDHMSKLTETIWDAEELQRFFPLSEAVSGSLFVSAEHNPSSRELVGKVLVGTIEISGKTVQIFQDSYPNSPAFYLLCLETGRLFTGKLKEAVLVAAAIKLGLFSKEPI